MAIITPSTFDPLLRYANVRLQQGVLDVLSMVEPA